jgi:hypothetical protein
MPRIRVNYYLDTWQLDAMKGIMTRDGVLVSEQIRRAISAYLKTKGIVPPARKASARKADR